MSITLIAVIPLLIINLILSCISATPPNNRPLNNGQADQLTSPPIKQPSRQIVPVTTVNVSTSTDLDQIHDKLSPNDQRNKLIQNRYNQSANGTNSKQGKSKQNILSSSIIQSSMINPGQVELINQHSGETMSFLRSSDDLQANKPLIQSVEWRSDDDADKNDLSKYPSEEVDDDLNLNSDENDGSGDDGDDLSVDDNDDQSDDYSNEAFILADIHEIGNWPNNNGSFMDNKSSITQVESMDSTKSEYIKAHSIVSIDDSDLGASLILSKLPIERFDARQKSVRFPSAMSRSHRNGTRSRESCTLRPSLNPKQLPFV